MPAAFDGVRVLELGQIYNGPYCGLLLAQLGADVIKIEPPGGEQLRFRSHQPTESHEFVMLNSNKRSVVLDLKTDAGRQALLDLVETADVLIENFAPGTMERLQLAPQRLLEHNPRLVVASGKGYGSTGPYAHMSAMDITVQAMSGSAATTGEPDGPPTKAGAAFVDFSGGIHLFGAVSAALFQRERTGRGQIVEVSMHDSVYPMLASTNPSAPAISTFTMSSSPRSPPEANSRVPPPAPNGAPFKSRIDLSTPLWSRSTFSPTSA